MTTRIVPFAEQHLAAAGELLARCHRRDRISRPELPTRFEDPVVAARAVEAAWRAPWASGVAMFDRGRMRGFLIGELTVADMARERSASIRRAGHAVDPEVDPRLLQRLYAAAAPAWLAAGCFSHDVTVPVSDAAELHTWFGVGFGLEQAWGLRALTDADLADDALQIPDSCIELNVAATVEDERGRGVGRLLTERGLAAAREAGYDWCIADWRTANLLASSFWPKRGFREVVYRLRRRIDERIARANGDASSARGF